MNKNNFKKAVALKYDPKYKPAPHVIAKGSGKVAENIIEAALNHEVTIKEDKTLAQLLYELEINDQIPAELYPIIAEMFAIIYEAEQKLGALSHGK